MPARSQAVPAWHPFGWTQTPAFQLNTQKHVEWRRIAIVTSQSCHAHHAAAWNKEKSAAKNTRAFL